MTCRWLLGGLALLLSLLPVQSEEGTVLHFKSGTSVSGQLVFCTDNRIRLKLAATGKEVSYDLAGVDRVEFAPLPGEAEALAAREEADPAVLETLWEQRRSNLKVPRNPAARIGMLLAARRAGEGRAETALSIYRVIERQSWDSLMRREAMLARLEVMVRAGGELEAVAEAERRIEEAKGDRVMVARLRLVMLEDGMRQLEELVSEHPLWAEDDYVKPLRNRLYNETLDGFLKTYLFHGGQPEIAARGLWGAVRIYQSAEENELAAHCARDITLLYGNCALAGQAADFLEQHRKREAAGEPQQSEGQSHQINRHPNFLP